MKLLMPQSSATIFDIRGAIATADILNTRTAFAAKIIVEKPTAAWL